MMTSKPFIQDQGLSPTTPSAVIVADPIELPVPEATNADGADCDAKVIQAHFAPEKDTLAPSEYIATEINPMHSRYFWLLVGGLIADFALVLLSGFGIGDFSNQKGILLFFEVAVLVACASNLLLLLNGTIATPQARHLVKLVTDLLMRR